MKDIFFKYRISFLLALISIVFLLASLFFNSVSTKSSPVIFTTNESTASAQISKSINVDIEGEVEKPGVYSMSGASRVNDLLEKAGGLTDIADKVWVGKYLNKAQLLHDGDKLYIPSLNEYKTNQTNSNTMQSDLTSNIKININSASQSELEDLPGIGEKTAIKIIEGRPFQNIEDLKNKKVVGESVFSKIKELISIL